MNCKCIPNVCNGFRDLMLKDISFKDVEVVYDKRMIIEVIFGKWVKMKP